MSKSKEGQARGNRVVTYGALQLVCVILVGCGDPLYEAVEFQPDAEGLVLTSRGDESRYEWPIRGGNYQVTKPPPLAYLTSFEEQFSFDDDFDAPLVAWDDLELGESAEAFMQEAFRPLPEKPLERVATIDRSEMAGPQAFDLSADGERLVLVKDEELILYNVENGERIGKMALPGDWSSGAAQAVRFCGRNKDFLVASPAQICRISGKDGQVMARIDGCKANLKKWMINHSDESMLMLTEEGKVYGGDSKLKYFSLADVTEEVFVDVALSEDGRRVIGYADRREVFYYQENNRIVSKIDVGAYITVGKNAVIAGINSDGWVDTMDLLTMSGPANDPNAQRKMGHANMFWRPHFGVACTDNDEYNWFLLVGERVVEDARQWILFDFGPTSLNHSIAAVIDELPERLVASRNARIVALLQSDGLQLHRRESYRSPNRIFMNDRGYAVVNDGPNDQIEKLYEAIGRQKRWVAGECPSQIQTDFLEIVGDRWNYLEKNESELEDRWANVLKRLRQWYQEGSVIAKAVNGYRLDRLAWKARGSGTIETVSRQGWEKYRDFNARSIAEFREIEDSDKVPALALSLYLADRMQEENDITVVDPLIRRAVQLYPADMDIAFAVGFMLTPQWGGAPGEIASFCHSHSQLYSGMFSDIAYARLAGHLTRTLHQTAVDFRAIRTDRAIKGIRYRHALHWPVSWELWNLKTSMRLIGANSAMDTIYRYFVAEKASTPKPSRTSQWYTPDVDEIPDKLFAAAKHAKEAAD